MITVRLSKFEEVRFYGNHRRPLYLRHLPGRMLAAESRRATSDEIVIANALLLASPPEPCSCHGTGVIFIPPNRTGECSCLDQAA